ncbi:MAG: hypothetical protein JW748_13790 [Anaerolineales bacterium]|nr:hypothetical protein [Anaerolineales bacterium]
MAELSRKPRGSLSPEQASFLKYEGEDRDVYILSDCNGSILRVPKNRNQAAAFPAEDIHTFTPAYILLFAAFLGLAPAGLGTLVFAPPAMLWALGIAVLRRPGRAGWIRIAVVWTAAALMLLAALPLAMRFLERIG